MAATGIMTQASAEGRTQLTEIEAKELIRKAGIPRSGDRVGPLPGGGEVDSPAIGLSRGDEIVSPDVVHKSDAGGVKLTSRAHEELVSPTVR